MITPKTLTVLLALSTFTLVYAQTDNTLGIEAIEAHFSAAGLVPSLLANFTPSALLGVSFGTTKNVAPGTPLTVDVVKPQPNITVTPANSSVTLTGKYTIAMVDADVVGTNEDTGQTRHWLMNGVTVANSAIDTKNATAITSYGGPLPGAGTGPHRYVILLYSQTATFKAPPTPTAGSPVATFDFNSYVKQAGLGPLVAGMYFTVEQGTASFSISPTTAVVTSTLPAAQTGTASGSASPSGSSTSTKKSDASTIAPYISVIISVAVMSMSAFAMLL